MKSRNALSRTARLAPALLALVALSGCGAVGRLKSVGKAPKLTASETPVAPALAPSLGNSTASGRTGAGDAAQASAPHGASLFRTGAGAFFNDQRASRVGDIVTIKINIADNATVNNTTTRTRDGSETGSVAALLGMEGVFGKNPSSAVDTSTASSVVGVGDTKRSEQINMTIAATVVGVLPNGNLQIRGRQEVRVNFELRELVVTGIIRPEDIGRDNTISHTQIADARISYGGRGQLTDAQQARWGQQIYDALFPF